MTEPMRRQAEQMMEKQAIDEGLRCLVIISTLLDRQVDYQQLQRS